MKPHMSRLEGLRLRPIDLTDVHVLVVDDYDDTLGLFSTALHSFGANVLTARSANGMSTRARKSAAFPYSTLPTNSLSYRRTARLLLPARKQVRG